MLKRERETEIFMDSWGLRVRRWTGREGVPQILKPATGADELDGYFHDPDQEARYAGLGETIRRVHGRDLSAIFTMSDHWGGLYHIFGLKNLLKLVHLDGRLV